MDDHISHSFDVELNELDRLVHEMFVVVETAVTDSIDALLHGDIAFAARAISASNYVDLLWRKTEDQVMSTISKRAPLSVDLREIVGALKTSRDLGRIGDLARNIAKRVPELRGAIYADDLHQTVHELANGVLMQLSKVGDAYFSRDLTTVLSVWNGDQMIDAAYLALMRKVLGFMQADPNNIASGTHLVICAVNIERMGNHASNVAATVHYVALGRPIIGGYRGDA